MGAFDNINLTTSAGVAPSQKEQFYIRKMLEYMKPVMVHGRDAQKVRLPDHNGTKAQFRAWNPLGAVTTPLTEAVTPDGQSISMTAFTAVAKPFGAYVPFSDELQWQMVDNMDDGIAKLLADQASLSLDTITRDALNSGLNVQFTKDTTTSRASIASGDILKYQDIKRAVRTLKRKNRRPFSDGFYHAIVHPDAVYDLTNDSMWVDVAKYQDKMQVERYELGMIYKTRFFESTNAKVFTGETNIYGSVSSITIANGSWDAQSRTLKSSTVFTPENIRQLAGKFVNVKGSTGVLTPMAIEYAKTDGTIKLRWDPGATVTANWATGVTIVPTGTGASSIPVYSTLIYGEGAFGEVSLDGGTNVRVLMNKPDASNDDPLAQRGTIGWKVRGFCASILAQDALVRLESSASA